MIDNYYVERALRALFTVWAVMTLSFGLVRLMPGGPMDYIRARMASQQGVDIAQANRMVKFYTNVHPDEPLYVQYYDYMISTMMGDLGVSMWFDKPVIDILMVALPWTVFVMSISLMLTFGIGVALGAIMAYIEGSKFDTSVTLGGTLLNSIPYYVMGIVLIYVLGYQFNWFPTGGRISSDVTTGLNVAFVTSAFYHAALPIFSTVITGFGGQALSMRGNSIRVLGEDYIRVARLRGLPPREIALRYVGRNAILPMYTGIMISIGFMFGGSVILEEIFSYPGVGFYMFRGVQTRDYQLMMGAFLLITIAVVIGILIADLTYGKIDPRASTGGGEREAF